MRVFLDNCIKHVSVQRMLPHWKSKGVSHSTTPKECDVQLSLVKVSNWSGLPLALRLDGIYYDLNDDYTSRNARISEAHSKADAVIYQSLFCMGMCEAFLAPKRRSAKEHIIYNGADPHWCGTGEINDKCSVVCSARWRRHKRLEETIDVFTHFNQWHKSRYDEDAVLHVFGDTVNNVLPNKNNIVFHGHVDYEYMRPYYRSADMCLHLSKRDCCPNAVVEAITAGVPTITTAACGGAAELCAMTPWCHVSQYEEYPVHFDPCAYYVDDYNVMRFETVLDLVDVMKSAVLFPIKPITIPLAVRSDYMAQKYTEVFEELL